MEGPVATKLRLLYDKEGDILHMDTVVPYREQESDEIGDAVIARSNPVTGAIENLEILFFVERFQNLGDAFELPVAVEMRLLEGALASGD